jgi:hypothetical protein
LTIEDTAANGLNQRFGGEYKKPDVYSPWQRPSNMKRMDREYITKNMEPGWKAVTNFGMDTLEAAPKLMMPGGMAYYAVSDAGDTSNEALHEGDDYQTAFGKGTAQGFLDYLTGKAAEKTFKYFSDLNKNPNGVKIGEEAGKTAEGKSVKSFNTYGDALKDKLGPAYKSHKEDINDSVNAIKKVEVINTYDKNDGSEVTEYNNKSWSLINHNTNTYIFMTAELTDFEINCKNETELKNIIETYKNCKEFGYF